MTEKFEDTQKANQEKPREGAAASWPAHSFHRLFVQRAPRHGYGQKRGASQTRACLASSP